MTYTFRPAVRENVQALIAFVGESGSGKTFSALEFATGLSGGKKFAVIDTEARRGLHYADRFNFDHLDMTAPFSPERHVEAVRAAEAQGYDVIVIDSMSLEWSGEGGVLDWREKELDAAVERARISYADKGWNFNESKVRESHNMSAWIKPKMAHKLMMSKFMQSRAHIIFCLRADPKTAPTKKPDGKTVIEDKGFQPVCEKNFMYEMTASFIFSSENPGVGKPIKLQEQHRAIFLPGQQINRECGERMAVWSKGGVIADPKRQAAEKWANEAAQSIQILSEAGKTEWAAANASKVERLSAYRDLHAMILSALAGDALSEF